MFKVKKFILITFLVALIVAAGCIRAFASGGNGGVSNFNALLYAATFRMTSGGP